MTHSLKPKAFVLIADDQLYFTIKNELEVCGFQVEGLLSELPVCELILLDHEALRLDIMNYLSEMKIVKPALLVLTEEQKYSILNQSHRIFQDVLVVRDTTIFETGRVLSMLEGEASFQDLFARYLPGVPAFAVSRHTRKVSAERLSGAA